MSLMLYICPPGLYMGSFIDLHHLYWIHLRLERIVHQYNCCPNTRFVMISFILILHLHDSKSGITSLTSNDNQQMIL